MSAFRTGLGEAKKSGGNPFAHLTLDQRRELCLDVLNEVGAQNISERHGHELYHSCVLPFGNHPNGDRNPSASVNYEKMVAGCFVCGNGGWLWWVAAVRGLESSASARDWVLQQVGPERIDSLSELLAFFDSLSNKEAAVAQPPPVYDPRILDKWMFIHPYLTEWRGVPVDNVRQLKVGYGKLSIRVGDRQYVESERIVIPHFFEGKLHGWQSRRLRDDGTPKYVSTPDMPKDTTLYHYDRTADTIVVVESPMTVVRHTHHAHLTATFGASVTTRQIDLLARSRARRVILWFDNDTAGWNATETVGAQMMDGGVVWAAQSPFEGDPGDLTDEQFDSVLSECVVPFALWRRPDGSDLRPLEEESDGHQEVRGGQGTS